MRDIKDCVPNVRLIVQKYSRGLSVSGPEEEEDVWQIYAGVENFKIFCSFVTSLKTNQDNWKTGRRKSLGVALLREASNIFK